MKTMINKKMIKRTKIKNIKVIINNKQILKIRINNKTNLEHLNIYNNRLVIKSNKVKNIFNINKRLIDTKK